MMFIDIMLSFLALTCLSSKPLYDHKQVSGLERKNAPAYNDYVNISNQDGIIRLSCSITDSNMTTQGLYSQSITFIGNSDIHGFNGANHITYNDWSNYDNYSALNNRIATYNQDLGTYYIGYLDHFIGLQNQSMSFLIRQYFVNPKTIGQGVYYFDDVTWHNVYDVVDTDPSSAWEDFGSWLSNYDYINSLQDYDSTITIDEIVSGSYIDFYTDQYGYYRLRSFETLNAIEPQRHYGDTYTINGDNSGGQNLNDKYISFLPYMYVYYCYDDPDLGNLYGLNTQINFYHYQQTYTDGYNAGFNAGYEQGYNEGYGEGENEGYGEGEQVGYHNGYDEGYQIGYGTGFTEADNMDETALTIFTGIVDVGLLPINFFLAMLNFEVFGINIGGLVSAFMTIAIVIIIARVIMGGKKDD